jgi:hypothetical protein
LHRNGDDHDCPHTQVVFEGKHITLAPPELRDAVREATKPLSDEPVQVGED